MASHKRIRSASGRPRSLDKHFRAVGGRQVRWRGSTRQGQTLSFHVGLKVGLDMLDSLTCGPVLMSEMDEGHGVPVVLRMMGT
jgi:hypothetical protein